MNGAPSRTRGFIDMWNCTIPAELRGRRQWVVWRYEAEPGAAKPRKRLYSPHGGYAASHSRPRDWGTYSEALAAYAQGGYDGIGYVFSQGDPFTGVDFDDCMGPAGTFTPWVAAWLARFDSYSEYSPSGTGVHVIVRAVLAGACKTHRCELYDRERFFTVTGRRVPGTLATIAARQDAVQTLIAELRPNRAAHTPGVLWAPASTREASATLRERAAAGRIRRATLALLDSAGPDGYGSPSEADAAIAAGLVGAGLTADETLTLLLDSVRGHDAESRKGQRYALAYWRRTVEHAAGYVGPVLMQPAGQRIRLGNGTATALRLAGIRLRNG